MSEQEKIVELERDVRATQESPGMDHEQGSEGQSETLRIPGKPISPEITSGRRPATGQSAFRGFPIQND
jgi:hypothetical protein